MPTYARTDEETVGTSNFLLDALTIVATHTLELGSLLGPAPKCAQRRGKQNFRGLLERVMTLTAA